MCLPLPGCVAQPQNGLWKNGDDEAAADISECAQIQQSRKATYILKVMSMMVYVLRSQVFFFQ